MLICIPYKYYFCMCCDQLKKTIYSVASAYTMIDIHMRAACIDRRDFAPLFWGWDLTFNPTLGKGLDSCGKQGAM